MQLIKRKLKELFWEKFQNTEQIGSFKWFYRFTEFVHNLIVEKLPDIHFSQKSLP